jgi:hypothetical protein
MDLQKPDAYKNINTSQPRDLDENYVPTRVPTRPLTADELQERAKDLFGGDGAVEEEERGHGLYCMIL